jgi:hypothetical protein
MPIPDKGAREFERSPFGRLGQLQMVAVAAHEHADINGSLDLEYMIVVRKC